MAASRSGWQRRRGRHAAQGRTLAVKLGALNPEVSHGEAAGAIARRGASPAVGETIITSNAIPDVGNKLVHAVLAIGARVRCEDVHVVCQLAVTRASASISLSFVITANMHSDSALLLPHGHMTTETGRICPIPAFLVTNGFQSSRKVCGEDIGWAELHQVNLPGLGAGGPVARRKPERSRPGTLALGHAEVEVELPCVTHVEPAVGHPSHEAALRTVALENQRRRIACAVSADVLRSR